jgi:hypothetical protein
MPWQHGARRIPSRVECLSYNEIFKLKVMFAQHHYCINSQVSEAGWKPPSFDRGTGPPNHGTKQGRQASRQ